MQCVGSGMWPSFLTCGSEWAEQAQFALHGWSRAETELRGMFAMRGRSEVLRCPQKLTQGRRVMEGQCASIYSSNSAPCGAKAYALHVLTTPACLPMHRAACTNGCSAPSRSVFFARRTGLTN